ncbi:MAG: ABC transporter permease [Micrococcales bacterium]|nr:ABC transporter permease [Micrococcales bacterium]
MASAEVWHLVLGVSALVGIAVAVLGTARVPVCWAPATAVARGALQLALVALVLHQAITDARLVAAALTVMFVVATLTASRRLGGGVRRTVTVAGATGVGVVVALGVVFATGALAATARYVLALGGIVIGNAMTFATLTGRRFTGAVVDRWDEIEGWLALGATPAQATRQIARESVRSALIPNLDQTRTTGLVTLPGAFVGAIFGGVSPLEAGRFQIVVLAAVLAAGSVTGVLLLRWSPPTTQRPSPPPG